MRYAVVVDDGDNNHLVDAFVDEGKARRCYQSCIDEGPVDGTLEVELVLINEDDDYLETLEYYEFNKSDKD